LFDCDECGKNSVSRPGDWCPKCQESELHSYLNDQAQWFSQCALCLRCSYAWGAEPSDKCEIYGMPLYMVARKNKCKHFKEYIDNGVF